MSTSLLYHGFGIRGYDYLHSRYENKSVIFKIKQRSEDIRCSVCGSCHVIRKGKKERKFRSVPIGGKAVWIVLEIQRVLCLSCKLVRQTKVKFAEARRSYTKSFERYALELCRHMTIVDVARHLGVSWDVIKDIQKRYLKKRFSKPKLNKLKLLAIDEISIGKGHKYLTIVLDLKSGAVVFVGDGKGADALEPFWKRIKRFKSRIKAVAIDMSPAYISAVSTNLPDASIVFDHFHIMKLYNDKLSELRRKVYQTATKFEKNVIKGTRWLLLKNAENLDDKHNEKERLEAALELNKPLAIAYYMKEELRRLWMQKDKKQAEAYLYEWIERANASKIPILMKIGITLGVHRTGILAYYDYPISTGPLEGTNNKIKTMKRQAYGFRDIEFFKLKIMGLHLTKYALVG